MASITVNHCPRPRYIQQGDKAPIHEVIINPAELAALIGGIAGGVPSIPPSGFKRVTNLYVNSAGKLIVAYEDTPVP
jgi:hypothetical protein